MGNPPLASPHVPPDAGVARRSAAPRWWSRPRFPPGWSLAGLLLLAGAADPDRASGWQTTPTSTPTAKVSLADRLAAADAARGNGGSRDEEPLDLSFDDLKFDIEKGEDYDPSMLTDALRQLDGRTIRLRGFIRPSFKQSGIKNFILVRDNQECCFGPGAALYDCVMVKMAEEESVEFTVRPISVVGTLYLKEYIGKDKKVWAIFRMKDTRQE